MRSSLMKKFSLFLVPFFWSFFAAAQSETTVENSRPTIDVPISTAIPGPTRLEVNFVAESYAAARAANLGQRDAFSSEPYIGFAHALSDSRKIQYRQYFLYNASDYTRE